MAKEAWEILHGKEQRHRELENSAVAARWKLYVLDIGKENKAQST